MLEIKLSQYQQLACCRYCFSEENEPDLVSPCKCKGTTKYVHKKCLKEWFVHKNNKIVMPGAFHQFDHSCEICHTAYKLSFNNIETEHKLYYDLFVYILSITSILLSTYIGLGFGLQQTGHLFTERGSLWENVFYNGFILTHIILGIFYICVLLFISLFGGGITNSCVCCLFLTELPDKIVIVTEKDV